MTPRAIAQIFGEAERLQAGVYLPASQRTANVLPRDTPIFLNRNGKLAAVFSAHGLTPLAPPPPPGGSKSSRQTPVEALGWTFTHHVTPGGRLISAGKVAHWRQVAGSLTKSF